MYESPILRRMRQATAEAAEDAEFTERLVDAIDNDPDVQRAILRLLTRNQRATPRTPPADRRSRKGR